MDSVPGYIPVVYNNGPRMRLYALSNARVVLTWMPATHAASVSRPGVRAISRSDMVEISSRWLRDSLAQKIAVVKVWPPRLRIDPVRNGNMCMGFQGFALGEKWALGCLRATGAATGHTIPHSEQVRFHRCHQGVPECAVEEKWYVE